MRFEIDVATGYYDLSDPPPFDADAFFSVHHPSHEPDEPPPAPRNLLLEEGEDANAGPVRRRGSGGVGSEGDVSDGHEAADEKRSPDLFSRLAASYAALHGKTLTTTEAKDAASWCHNRPAIPTRPPSPPSKPSLKPSHRHGRALVPPARTASEVRVPSVFCTPTSNPWP